MIPNVIHYCWFSDDEMPPIVKKCIDSWHRYCPDYEFRLWDMESIRDIDVPYLREALECRKWAFAADYVRLWAVEKYGGIYLDSDIQLLKSLDEFRGCRMFIGREEPFHVRRWRPLQFLTSHIFGAEAHHPFLKDCLLYYTTRHFHITDEVRLPELLRCDYRIAPEIQALIAKNYGYDARVSEDRLQHCSEGLEIYPSSVLGRGLIPLEESVCLHHGLASWTTSEHSVVAEPAKVPGWRKIIEYLDMGGKFRTLMRKLGYVVYKI